MRERVDASTNEERSVGDFAFAAAVPLREVRFAVTMVGGTSLAIYECGASLELWRMVRGEGMYGLLKCLTNSHAYVDILSGTSAGGINAITLAAAITNGTDIKAATDIWVRDAGIDDLLQRPEDGAGTTLFRGNAYYLSRIQDCFGKLTDRRLPAAPAPFASGFPGDLERGFNLDLFVTGTYYDAQNRAFFDITRQPIYTADYNGVFHLEHAPKDLPGRSHLRGDLDDPEDPFVAQGKGWSVDDKTGDRVRNRLARIARTTSCLPAVFEPSNVTQAEVGNVIRLSPPAANTSLDAPSPHWFFDGGFLNNRPIDLALREIYQRVATVEASRKIVFVEPVAVEQKTKQTRAGGPNAIEALEFYLSVPGNQSLSATLEGLTEFNRKVVRLQAQLTSIRKNRIQKSVTLSLAPGERDVWNQLRWEDLADALEAAYRQGAGLADSGGVAYVADNGGATSSAAAPAEADPNGDAAHVARDRRIGQQACAEHARIVDFGANGGGGSGETNIAPDLLTLKRWIDLVRTEVRDLRFPISEDQKPMASARQARYLSLGAAVSDRKQQDASVRATLDQLYFLREMADTCFQHLLAAATERGVAAAQQATAAQNPAAQMPGFADLILGDAVGLADTLRLNETFVRKASDTLRAKTAKAGSPTLPLTTLAEFVGGSEQTLFALTIELAEKLAMPLGAVQPWEPFAWARDTANENGGSIASIGERMLCLDALLYPVRRFADLKGESRVDLVYVSARSRKGGLSAELAQNKLAGDALFNLGGFLKRGWRVNDILWGRLDTADALVDALLEPTRLERLMDTGGNGYTDRLIDAVRSFVDNGSVFDAVAPKSASSLPPSGESRDALAPLVENRVYPLFAQVGEPDVWKTWRAQVATINPTNPERGKELAALLKPWLLIRTQIEIVNEEVPTVYASEIAEWAEQAAQNLTPEQARNASMATFLPPLSRAMSYLVPLPAPGAGAVADQLSAIAADQIEARLPQRDGLPAAEFLSRNYQVGAESPWRDIPLLVTCQRGAQSMLVVLQIVGKLVPPKVDTLLFKLPRGIAWVLYGLFLSLRQGRTGRTAALSTAVVLIVGIPVLFVLGLTVPRAQIPLFFVWTMALCLGGAVTHLRRGAGLSVPWFTSGIALLLFAMAFYYRFTTTPHLPIVAAPLLLGGATLLILGLLVRALDRAATDDAQREAQTAASSRAPIAARVAAISAAIMTVCVWRAWKLAHGQLTPFLDTDWIQWATGALGLGATAISLYLGIRQAAVLKPLSVISIPPRDGAGAAKPAGIVDFEMAGSGAEAVRLLTGWQETGVKAAFASLQIDQWYVAAYVAALTLLNVQGCFWLHSLPGVPPLAAFLWGTIGGICAIVAGGLDYTENLCLFGAIEACRYSLDATGERRTLLVTLADMGSLPALAGRAARIKFRLSFAAILLAALPAFWQTWQFVQSLQAHTVSAANDGLARGIVASLVTLFALLFIFAFLGPFARSLRKPPRS